MSKSSAQVQADTFLDTLVNGVEKTLCIGTLLTGKSCDNEHQSNYPTCVKCRDYYCRSCEQDIRADKSVRDFLTGINRRVEQLDKEGAQVFLTRVYGVLSSRDSKVRESLPVDLYRTRKGQILHFNCVTRYAEEQEAQRQVSGPFR